MKNQMLSFAFMAMTFMILLSSGCTKDPANGADPGSFTPASSSVKMSATVDGTSWTADEIQSSSTSTPTGWQFIIQGKSSDDRHLTFTLQTLNNTTIPAGNYELGGQTDYLSTVIWTSGSDNYILKVDTNSYGNLNIDQLGGNRSAGSFTVDLFDDILNQNAVPITVTGTFDTDNYRNFN